MKLKLVASLFCFLAISANAAQPIAQVPESVAMVQYMAKQEALSLAPIKNQSDLSRVLRGNSSIDYLSPTAKDIFLESLAFGDNGLSSFNIQVIKDELDFDQAYQVLSLFGMQHLVRNIDKSQAKTFGDFDSVQPSQIMLNGTPPYMRDDHEGYYCRARATCAKSVTEICTSNC